VIEDDSGGEPRYAGPPVPALRALDREGRVLSLGDFSDLMLPGVHLAWASVPGDGEDAWATAFADLAGRGAGAVEQRAAAHFLLEGHVERHARRLRVALEERGVTLVSSLRRELGRSVELVRPAAGTHLVVGLRGAGDPALVARRAAAAGVRISTLAEYALVPPAENRLVLGYAGTAPREIEAAVRSLAAVIRAPLPAPSARASRPASHMGTARAAFVAR
jgi:GntR family transcriptional regulator/MocR family aminotransferase